MSAKPFIRKNRFFTFCYYRDARLAYCIVMGTKGGPLDGLWLDVRRPITLARRFLGYLRRPFPYFYSIGLRDCDSGGRVCAWHVDWCANYWRQQALFDRWNGAGDGEVIHQIRLTDFIRAVRHFRKEGHHA